MENIKCGEGILAQIANTKVYSLNEKINWEDLKKTFREMDEKLIQQQKEKNTKFNSNMKFLAQRSRELQKEIPAEVLAVVYIDQPVGSKFFERNKEWFN